MKKENKNIEDEFLECESFRVFLLMIAVGGFLGGYTFTLKGGVFCNAQTANFVMLAVQLGNLNFRRALYYFIPITAYLLGTVISELCPKKINRTGLMRWDTFFVAFEMLALFVIGFVPDSAPAQICQVAINFIASMQYNTFRQADKIPMATTFCTNHIRQVGVHLVKWIKGHGGARKRFFKHLSMILFFIAGAIAATAAGSHFGGRAIWFAEIPLAAVFIDLLLADRGRERDKLNVVPHGH